MGPPVRPRPSAYLRVRLVDGRWIAGRFAADSYAGGYPNDPDLLLEEAYALDEDTGAIGDPLAYPVHIPAGQISWIEVVPDDDDEDGDDGQVS